MKNLWLHVYAWLVAAGFVYLEVTGAIVAGQEGTPVGPHRIVAGAVAVLVIGLAIWLMAAEKRVWLRRLGWIALAGVVAEAGLGEMSGTASPMASMLHAFLAPLLLAIVSGDCRRHIQKLAASARYVCRIKVGRRCAASPEIP